MDYLAKQYDKKAFGEYGKAIIDGYLDIVEVLNIVKGVAQKMNGKVLNKRFITEIETQLASHPFAKARLSMDDQYNLGYRDINIYLEHRSISINGSWVYFDSQIYCRNIHNVEKSFCNEEGRLDCAKVEACCDDYINQCKKYMTKWQDAIDNYDTYTAQLKNAVIALGKALNGLNDYFMPSDISKYDWEHAKDK